MKQRLILLGSLIFLSSLTYSCRESTPTETQVREVEVEKPAENDTSPESEGALERAAKKVDQRVNDEIDEEIDRIGDDN